MVDDSAGCVRLIIVHYHLRPGGVRRVIEQAAPYLVAEAPRPVSRVVLAVGEGADAGWHQRFAQGLRGLPVEVRVVPSFRYFSEQRAAAHGVVVRLRRAIDELMAAGDCLVWTHNPGVGRNLLLARELAAACAARDVPLVVHHHDWWFDNRWQHWPGIRRSGIRTLAAAAAAVFPNAGRSLHVAVNQADAAVLARHFPQHNLWLPNLTERATAPSATRLRAARSWLGDKLATGDAPVWLVPCRALRRKNLAEALLITRWLRPEAWLVVTGGASSAEEEPYCHALEAAARQHRWHLRLGVLAGEAPGQPEVADLLAVSEAVVFTSLQEGFGLPFLEAAAAARPLIARRLPNIMPDLDHFGFRFPQVYGDILIDPALFDWRAERARQARTFREWRATMPRPVRKLVAEPAILAALAPCAVAFSRLTLAGQLDVLACPPDESWATCQSLNPFLATWRRRAADGALRVTPWPRQADRCLGGGGYARRLHAAVAATQAGDGGTSALEVQTDFMRNRLAAPNLHPLLWKTFTPP